MDPLRRLQPGDSVAGHLRSAQRHNLLSDAARIVLSGQRNQAGESVISRARAATTALVKNTSGAAVVRFAVLSLESWFPDPADNLPAFQAVPVLRGETPIADDTRVWCVLQESAAENGIVPAVLLGVTPVQIDITDTSHQYATLGTTSDNLVSAGSGDARIIIPATTTGVQWSLVRIGGGASSGATVHFEIDEYDEYSGAIYAVLTTLPPDGVVPGRLPDGRISLVDVDGCLLDEPPEELIGRRGHAHWQRVLDEYGGYTLAWVVGGLCCPPVEPLAE